MSTPSIRILLVEDNPGDALLIREILRDADGFAFHVEHVERLACGLARLDAGSFDVVLLDLSLPDSLGLDTLRRVHSHNDTVPVVVLTGTNDQTQAVRAVQEGAQDYLVKGTLDPHLLARSLRYAIERHRMLLELEAARRLEHYTATHDLLTALPNRQLFHDRLSRSIGEARRNGGMVAVLFLDLDRFKFTNDTLGHSAGDRLLKEVAKRLRTCLRDTDTAARWGGDEFTLVLTGLDEAQDALRVARKILAQLEEPFHVDGHELYVTTSIGISLWPTDGVDIDTLVKNADIAMYRAKAEGRNLCHFYTRSLTERALARMETERCLRLALERGEFELHYQPQLDVRTGQIVAVEALLRWAHPQRGLLTPSEFIPVAEDTGLIVPIGDWVLRTACSQNRAWREAGLPPVRMAVNISARQFLHQDPVAAVLAALEATGMDPSALELELTESAIMGDGDAASETLHRLRRSGVRISIDDFGTGYSSLGYLKRFPLERLKIDRLFIQNITVDRNDRAITAAIVAMAHSMDLKPVAEGVETAEQLEVLLGLGCEQMQGYLFSPPLTAEQATTLLAAQLHAPLPSQHPEVGSGAGPDPAWWAARVASYATLTGA